MDTSEAVLASAKTGAGIKEILEQVVTKIAPPKGDSEAPLQALIFDSHYDAYRGVIAYIRVVQGTPQTWYAHTNDSHKKGLR